MPGPFGPGGGPNYTAKGIAAMLGLVAALTTGYYFSVGGGSTGGLLFTEGTAAGTPAAGEQVVYAKSGGMYVKNSSGTESQLDAAGISGLTAGRIPVASSATAITNGTFTDSGNGTIGMPSTGAGSNGNSLTFTTAGGGTASSHAGYTSGSYGVMIGSPSAGNGTNMGGGDSGSFYVLGATGAVATGSGTSGIGTDVSLIAGSGGASSGASGTGGRGGIVDMCLGAGGAANGGVAGANGKFRVLLADLTTPIFTVNYDKTVALTGATTITGSADAKQLVVKGHSAQTDYITQTQTSAGSVGCAVDANGYFLGAVSIVGTSAYITSTNPSDVKFQFYGPGDNWNLGSDMKLNWHSGSTWAYSSGPTPDAGIKRAAAGVIRSTNGSTGLGWLQSSAGRVRRAATQTVADSTTLTVDDTLSVTLIAGRKYSFRIVYFFTTVNSSGVKIDLNGGTATATSLQGSALFYNLGTPALLATGTAELTALSTAVGITASGTNVKVEIEGEIVCNAAGTFIPRFAQNAETGAAESVVAKIGSFMWVEDMP